MRANLPRRHSCRGLGKEVEVYEYARVEITDPLDVIGSHRSQPDATGDLNPLSIAQAHAIS